MIKWLTLKYNSWKWPETMDCEDCAGKGEITFRRMPMRCRTCGGKGVKK